MNARAAAMPTPRMASTIAATAIRRVVRPSSARRARSSEGRGRGPPGVGSGRGREVVIAAQDALNGWEAPGRRRREASRRPDAVVPGIVLQLDEAELLEQRREVDAEPAAISLARPVPAA